jgi:RimJ/RimL family protein N-acetyltransferase
MSTMDITTDRLILHPLTPAEARRIVDHTPAPDDRWHELYPFEDELDPLRSLAKADQADPVFTLYMIRTVDDGLAIGGIGFFGPPDSDGAVELGYGIIEPLRGRGIATEALLAAAELALAHGATLVKADTTPDNVPSQRVLLKAGFRETHRTEESIYYSFSGRP